MIKELLKVESLTLDPKNAKLHPDWQVQTIVESIKQFGYCDPIAVRGENNMIIEGHGRYLALKQLGIQEVECIRLDYLTDDQAEAYAIAHNSTNLATGFDNALLAQQIAALVGKYDMGAFGVQLDKLDDAILAKDDNYEIPDNLPIRVKKGEIWELGRHRLVCGDSTDEQTLKRLFLPKEVADLVVTDPPYNVNYQGGTHEALTIENDNMESAQFRKFLTDAFVQMCNHLKPGGAYYVWLASREHVNFETALAAAGLQVREQLIWVKNTLVLGRQDYQWRHEPCMYGWKNGAAHYFRDDRTQTTVQEIDPPVNLNKLKKEELLNLCKKLIDNAREVEETIIREDKPSVSELHPTMKPVRLLARLIANSSRRDEVVLDMFGGSGGTLIACEQLGRRCRIVELGERYASVIVDRWEKYTGLTARRVDDGTGKESA